MNEPVIIICPAHKADDIKKVFNEVFPELDLKVYTDEKSPAITEDDIRKAVEEVLKQMADKSKDIHIPEPPITPANPSRKTWKPWSPNSPTVLMYGCMPTMYHTISQAEDNIRNSSMADIIIAKSADTLTDAINKINIEETDEAVFDTQEYQTYYRGADPIDVNEIVKTIKDKEKNNKMQQEKNARRYADKHYKK